jgi:hypothetical protein
VLRSLGFEQGLRPTADTREQDGQKRRRVVQEWGLADAAPPPPILVYAGLSRLAQPPAERRDVATIITEPFICASYVQDPATGTRYALPAPSPDMLMLRVRRPANATFAATLPYAARMYAQSLQLNITVQWEPFRKGGFYRVVFQRSALPHVLFALRHCFGVADDPVALPLSNEPMPLLPTLCRIPRIRMIPLGADAQGYWMFEDASTYFNDSNVDNNNNNE